MKGDEQLMSRDRLTRWIVFSGLLLIFCCLAIRTPLYSSLWLDETVTVWVASAEWPEAWRRAVTYQAQSPLYFMLFKAWPWRESSEFFARLPSLFCGGVAAASICLIGRELFGKGSSVFTLLFALTAPELVKISVQARPYALGMVGVLWSVLFLLWWVRSEYSRYLGAHFAMALLAFYGHYLFGLIGLVYLCVVLLWGNLSLWVRYLRGVLIALPVALPGCYHLLMWRGKAQGALFTTLPSLRDFFLQLIPPTLLVYLVGALIVGAIFSRDTVRLPSRRLLTLSGVWTVAGCVVLYGVSWVSGVPLFVDRYLSWRFGGLVLGAMVLASVFRDVAAQRAFFITYVFLALQYSAAQKWRIEDWSSVAKQITAVEGVPVVLYSGLRESEQLSVDASAEFRDYLAAPLSVYGVAPSRISVMPGDPTTADARDYGESVIGRVREQGGRFFLVVNDQPIVLGERGLVRPGKRMREFLELRRLRCEGFDSADGLRGDELVKISLCESGGDAAFQHKTGS